jgi:hypothetical protein
MLHFQFSGAVGTIIFVLNPMATSLNIELTQLIQASEKEE